jgi:hypothetical protein
MKYTTIAAATLAAALLLQPTLSQAQSSGALSFGKPKAGAAETVEVNAKGQGESVEAAQKDAIRNAIKMAVGELVGSKTLVENDDLVEDKILTLSNAMVEKADYGAAKSIGDGLFEVTVKALVKKGQLNQELEKAGITKGAVKGESLAAKLFSGRERIANAEKFLAERFKGFPGDLVEGFMLTKADGSPNIEVDTASGRLIANVGVQVNMENYAKWTKALQELLGQICLEKEETRIPFEEDTRSRQKPFLRSMEVPLKNVPNSFPVIVATPAAKKVKRLAWPATVYYLDSQMFMVFSRQLATFKDLSGHVEVVLKDEDNEEVKSKWTDFGEDAYSSKISDGFPMCAEFGSNNNGLWSSDYVLITPVLDHDFFRQSLSFSYNREPDPALALRIDLGKVEEDDLASVAGYEIKVEYRKDR